MSDSTGVHESASAMVMPSWTRESTFALSGHVRSSSDGSYLSSLVFLSSVVGFVSRRKSCREPKKGALTEVPEDDVGGLGGLV